ncbi:hypothetical protein CIB48_g5903 [Xylaria polymorpha]|nr:hypothetical protein CIB48_g5903 [Xylaria polymorpha]
MRPTVTGEAEGKSDVGESLALASDRPMVVTAKLGGTPNKDISQIDGLDYEYLEAAMYRTFRQGSFDTTQDRGETASLPSLRTVFVLSCCEVPVTRHLGGVKRT